MAKNMAVPKSQPALTYARRLNKDYGPVTVVRAVTQRFPRLRRRDVLAIASELKINTGTASRQFQEVRNNGLRVKLG